MDDEAALEEAAAGLKAALSVCATGAVADCKALISFVAGAPIDEPLRRGTAERLASRRMSPEGREGLDAFLSKVGRVHELRARVITAREPA